MADYLDDLMAANQELGDENNIFGAGNTAVDAMVQVQQQSGTNVVDYNRYANVPETQKIDYTKLTQVSDKDVYKVVSVQETIIKDDGDGGDRTEQTINYKLDGNQTDTTKLTVVEQTNLEKPIPQPSIDSDFETDKINKIKIVIENDDVLTMNAGGDTTIAFLKSNIPKLANSIFYDEDGYEVPNPNTKVEAIADIDGDQFVLNVKLTTNNTVSNPTDVDDDNATQTTPLKQESSAQHGYTDTVVVKNDQKQSEHGYTDTVVVKTDIQDSDAPYSSREQLMNDETPADTKENQSNIKFGGNAEP
eukprot:452860_1